MEKYLDYYPNLPYRIDVRPIPTDFRLEKK